MKTRIEPSSLLSLSQLQDSMSDYQPKTKLGKELLALRQSYLASGGKLLSPAELDEEMRLRRG
jgi:hypothetical protein